MGTGAVPEEARNRAVTAEELRQRLSKTGGTVFTADRIEIELDEGLTIPASAVNGLRRELLEELRGQGVTDLKDVQYAVLETSGQVSVLLRSEAQPVTPRQLSLNVTEQLLPVLLINDGRLLRDNMKKMDVDDDWLRRQLKREHLKDPSQVFLLALDQGGNVICQAKEDV